jgi:hypothetical protein
MTNKQTIEQRIAAALGNGATSSATITELIAEAETALRQAVETAEQEHERSLDLGCADPNKAAELARAAALRADRLRLVIPRLQEARAAAHTDEQHSRWLAQFRRVEAERDKLGQEFAREYPRLVDALVALFSRMAAVDADAQRVNSIASNAFDGEMRRLSSCEQYARAGVGGPEILTAAVLPSFHSRDLLWPPRALGVAAAYAALSAPSPAAPHAHTSDWWKDGDARSAQLRREAAEAEAFYSRQAETAEARENSDSANRARAAAAQRRSP